MTEYEQNCIEVQLGSRSYPIIIGRNLEAEVARTIKSLRTKKRPIGLITDSRVAVMQKPFVDAHFAGVPTYTLPEGESSKSIGYFAECLEYFAGLGLDRSTTLFALGGGVVGDFTGFVAASYMRGLDFIQIPTTLLAMVDSSVGGKTGLNLTAGKNLVGAFHQPQAVIIDVARLDTLDKRQFSAGMAEVIKAGMLADLSFFEKLESLPVLDSQNPDLIGIIRRACEIKAEVVAADEKESAATGGRALLNLGHTFGHAIEQNTGYSRYLHGEAISIGIVMAAHLSNILGCLGVYDLERIERMFKKYSLPTTLQEPLETEELLTAMGRDKKKQQGSLKYVVLQTLGRAKTQADIEPSLIVEALKQGGAC
jgi:3-dehydroquinate synthase